MTSDHAGNGNPAENGWAEESSLDWYFDLPSGAWERQEQKNRELRDRLRIQAKEQPAARAGAFKPAPEAPLGSDFPPGPALRMDPAIAAPVRRLRRSPGIHAFDRDFEDSEPAPAPLVLNRHRSVTPDETPPDEAGATTFFGFSDADVAFADTTIEPHHDVGPLAPDEPTGAVASAFAFDHGDEIPLDADALYDDWQYTTEPEPAFKAPVTGDTDGDPVSVAPAVGAETTIPGDELLLDSPPTSRWDDMLAISGDGRSIVEQMREWAAAGTGETSIPEAENAPDAHGHLAPGSFGPEAADTPVPGWAAALIEPDETEAQPASSSAEARSSRSLLARLLGRKRPSGGTTPSPAPESEWIVDPASEAPDEPASLDAVPAAGVADTEHPGDVEVEVKAPGVDENPAGVDAETDDAVIEAAASLVKHVASAPATQQDGEMPDRPSRPWEETTNSGDDPGSLPPPASPPEGPPAQDTAAGEDPWAEFLATREQRDSTAPFDAEEPVPFAGGSSGSDSGSPAVPVEPASQAPDPFSTSEDDLSWDAIVNASGVDDEAASGYAPPGIHGRGHPGRLAEAEPRWSTPLMDPFASGFSSTPAAPNTDPGEPPLPEEPAWIAEDEDIIVRAFEEHAAEAGDDDHEWVEDRRTPGDLSDLLGEDHEALVGAPTIFAATVANERHRWAPQRTIQVPDDFDDEAQPPVIGAGTGADSSDPLPSAPWEVPPGDGGFPAALQAGEQRRPWIRELIETTLLAILVFLAVRASFQNFRVDGQSMFPTLENGQYIIVNRLSYSQIDLDRMSDFIPIIEAEQGEERYVFGGPQRGDIIVFASPRDPSEDLIKRVIGLPNETIEIRNGQVYINDRLLEEPYIDEVWVGDKPKVLIPPGEYFVMGDNRNNSQDSRSSQVGLVPESLIIGKAAFSYLPFDRFGFAPNGGSDLGEEPVLTTQRIDTAE